VVELTAVAELAAVVVVGGSLLLHPAEIASTANEVTAKIEARRVRMVGFSPVACLVWGRACDERRVREA
jgi:hypothetical protein